jgi:hypothetical protein
MCCVDYRVDTLAGEIGGEALSATITSDTQRDRRRRGIRRRARQRQDWLQVGLVGDALRQRARLRRAAENEQAKALQATAP